MSDPTKNCPKCGAVARDGSTTFTHSYHSCENNHNWKVVYNYSPPELLGTYDTDGNLLITEGEN